MHEDVFLGIVGINASGSDSF